MMNASYKHKDVLSMTSELVKIDSTNPGNHEKAVLSYILEQLLPYSTVIEIVKEEVLPGRINLMATISCTKTGIEDLSENKAGQHGKETDDTSALVFICHMDTVPVGNDWTREPFGSEITDNRLYGRGACDMKSGLACAMTSFLHAAEHVKQGGSIKKTLKFIATIDEEGEMRGVEAAIKAGWITKNDWIMDTEPTSLAIEMAHKGRIWFHLTFKGIAAHASTPWKGADAIAAMSEAIVRIRSYIHGLPEHKFMGKTTVAFGTIKGGTHPYAVSDSCTVTIDLRTVPPTTTKSLQQALTDIIEEVRKIIPGVSGILTLTGEKAVIEENLNSPFLEELKKSYYRVIKDMPPIQLFPGYTDTAVIAGRLKNPHCLSFGPGSLEHAHKPDEFVDITEIEQCKNILTELVETLFD